jgi:hypothetical protein
MMVISYLTEERHLEDLKKTLIEAKRSLELGGSKIKDLAHEGHRF